VGFSKNEGARCGTRNGEEGNQGVISTERGKRGESARKSLTLESRLGSRGALCGTFPLQGNNN